MTVLNDDLVCLLEAREDAYKSIIGSNCKSKITNKEGLIVGINEKEVYLNFDSWGIIHLSYEAFNKNVEVNDKTNELISKYIDSFNYEKKLKKDKGKNK